MINNQQQNSIIEILEELWLKAEPCDCGNDDNWLQDITGTITCHACNSIVLSKNHIEEIRKEDK